MRRIKRNGRYVSILMTLILLLINAPVHSVYGVMVETETIWNNQDTQSDRENVRTFLDRKEVKSLLSAWDIDSVEAKNRVDSLSNTEVLKLADHIDQLPAGGDLGATLAYLAIIALLVLVITEMLGYTDIIGFFSR